MLITNPIDISNRFLGALCAEDAWPEGQPHNLFHEPERHETTKLCLPENVLDELRKLGMPLWAYNRGELEDAVHACAHDANLVDYAEGEHFRDKLQLTEEKKEKRNKKKNPPLYPDHHSHCDKLEREREECHAATTHCAHA